MQRSQSHANNVSAAPVSSDGHNSGSAFSSQVWKGFEEKHSLQQAREKELVNQTADFPCRGSSMGDGEDDSLGRGDNVPNDGAYSSGRYIDNNDNAGGAGDGEANRESTFVDFFNDTVLSNSVIVNDAADEFDDKQMMGRNGDLLMQNGAMKYIDHDLLREVVQTIRSTVKDHDNLD